MARKPLAPKIIVAGDVCIDWLSVPVESLVPGTGSPKAMNWQLRDGRHMYARRGGAWLTADFVEQAVGASARVAMPEEEGDLGNVPPEKIIHSMIMLGRGDRERDGKKVPFWVATDFEGYAGPSYPTRPEVKRVTGDTRRATLVLLDDAGNGFRDDRDAWPLALERHKPLVLYKVSRPLDEGALWKCLQDSHLDRTIALLGADELRAEGGSITRALSWERTATDLILSLAREPKFRGLRSWPFLVISLGIEGAVLVRCVDGRVSAGHLWYTPNLTEGALLRTQGGNMSGFGSAFAAAIAGALIRSNNRQHWEPDEVVKALRRGIRKGLTAEHRLLDEAFGPCKIEVPRGKPRTRAPEYPTDQIFKRRRGVTDAIFDVSLPDLPNDRSSKELSKELSKDLSGFRAWRIIDSKRKGLFSDLAAKVVRQGVDKVFPDVPIGKFGKLATLDRSEIESYRSLRKLISEFLDKQRPKRPLCLAVFGAPGSGKSFGVTEVAHSLDTEGRIEAVSFNVSQWKGPEYLVNALHRVRDYAIGGKVPLVFFDEFDCQFGLQKLGWLKYFLAPMQDGVFADGLFTHEIGKAILVFAGGTAATYAEFQTVLSADNETKALAGEALFPTAMSALREPGVKEPGSGEGSGSPAATEPTNESQGYKDAEDFVVRLFRVGPPDAKEESRNVKLPDFVSRLRGHVDIFGLDPPTDTNLLRRALVLRSNIERQYKSLIDASGTVRIDSGVLQAFLRVPKYRHGARSLEAILEMSNLVDLSDFDPSRLPTQHQLNLHVDGNSFITRTQHQPSLGKKLEQIARDIHEHYLESELSKKDKDGKRVYRIGDRPALRRWQRLSEIYKKSNREQAATYPLLLFAVGYGFQEGNPNPSFAFSPDELEILARMEHDRWMEERRITQPDHSALVPWEKLPQEEKDKDIRTVKKVPEFLGRAGLRVVRL